MNKTPTCEDCVQLEATKIGSLTLYGCGKTGLVVPHTTETGKDPVFHRIPLECPIHEGRPAKQ